jgi:hypothetical protein
MQPFPTPDTRAAPHQVSSVPSSASATAGVEETPQCSRQGIHRSLSEIWVSTCHCQTFELAAAHRQTWLFRGNIWMCPGITPPVAATAERTCPPVGCRHIETGRWLTKMPRGSIKTSRWLLRRNLYSMRGRSNSSSAATSNRSSNIITALRPTPCP